MTIGFVGMRLAFALTINKSQGQTFHRCGVMLSGDVFTHGQLYVAVSRVGNPRDLLIYTNQVEESINHDRQPVNVSSAGRFVARNIVYQEIFH